MSTGQSIEKIDLTWSSEASQVTVGQNNPQEIPNLENSFFSGDQFLFIQHRDRSNNRRYSIDLISYNTVAASPEDEEFIRLFNIRVDNELSIDVDHVFESGKGKLALSFVPYVFEGSSLKRIVSIEYKLSSVESVQMKTGHVFAENSVLAQGSGEWYRIRLDRNGVYRLSYSFLQEMGIDIDNVNPQHINIYGNGFGKLPELNSEYRPDDLLKNAIYVEGENDNSFDPEDYILFYGRGPNKWEDEGSAGFRRTYNIYAQHSDYFININSNESPKRIQAVPTSGATPTHEVTDYNSYTIYERELVSLIKGGQRWYGELFDADLTQSFDFTIPNLNTSEPVTVRSFMACSIGSTSGTTFDILYNNTVIGSANFNPAPADSYSRAGFTSLPGSFNPSSGNFQLAVRFNRTNPADEAYLDYIEVNARSFLRFSGNQFEFRDKSSVGVGNVADFRIQNFSAGSSVWEVTDLANPRLINGQFSGQEYSFTLETDSLRSFIAFKDNNYLTPTFAGRVEHQNLHALEQADYLIVTNELFLNQAQRLASLHESQGVSCHVVELQEIYNEFSGGTQDPTAIKFFVKMFYDRADGNTDLSPKYLALFGDGTYDPLGRIAGNNYLCPVYHTQNSENYIATLVSDDYFGFLDDEESFSPSDLLDIAVGRMIASTNAEAIDLVNKVEHYMNNGSTLYSSSGVMCDDDGFLSTQGDWRLRYTLIGDDQDDGYFVVNDLEPAYNYVTENFPEMNPNKIYSDAFQQVSTAGGQRYPDVNNEIDRSIDAGTLMTCYVGHGGVRGAAQERILTIGQINDWTNIGKLTLFVSATCEFARIDDPEFVSAGEWMALNPIGGAIALMTTTRAVFFSTNSITTSRFFENVFLRDEENKPRTFGEIITDTKNNIPGGSNNKRSFMLLGDPALRIALPYEKVVLDSVNGIAVNQHVDTLRALSKARLTGHLEDQFGNSLNSFNGVMQPSIFDKPQVQSTLGQDSDSPVIAFEQQKNVLYRGNVSIVNGRFDFDFIVPKDIDYSFGAGKSSFFAFDEQDNSAGGYSKDLIVGGIDTAGLDDNVGPEIELFLNDDSFVNGGITNETPILIAQLFDESGINTVGTGIGHDITVVLDQETSNAKVLNEYYEADLDTYQSGSLTYQLEAIEPGLHTLTFKAWDVNNNSSERTIEFNVQEDQEIALSHVLNYPNPFTTHTEFMFEHNQVCASLETKVEIYSVTGKLVKTIFENVNTKGFRVEGVAWDGRDEFGDQLAKGVYIYRVVVKNADGEVAEKMQKLYLLK